MRTIKGDKPTYQNLLKKVEHPSICDLCGGLGRYRETYRHKDPIIIHCYKCRGTGRLKFLAKYKGELQEGLWPGSSYLVIDENETHFVIKDRNKEIVQIEKTLFDEYWGFH